VRRDLSPFLIAIIAVSFALIIVVAEVGWRSSRSDRASRVLFNAGYHQVVLWPAISGCDVGRAEAHFEGLRGAEIVHGTVCCDGEDCRVIEEE
jgi:hypothetical protein